MQIVIRRLSEGEQNLFGGQKFSIDWSGNEAAPPEAMKALGDAANRTFIVSCSFNVDRVNHHLTHFQGGRLFCLVHFVQCVSFDACVDQQDNSTSGTDAVFSNCRIFVIDRIAFR